MALGWLYILSNETMPGLVKIGQSAMDPDLRAAELQTTGVPSPFIVEYKALFANYAFLERKVHGELSHARLSNGREFFKLSARDAVDAIRRIAEQPAKYEEISFSSRIEPQALPSGVQWISASEAESEAVRGLVRDLRKQTPTTAACPSCGKGVALVMNGLFKIACWNCGETWVQHVSHKI